MNTVTSNKQNKTKEKKPRAKRHDVSKLTAAMQAVASTIAEATNTKSNQVDLNRVNASLLKATTELASTIGVPASRLHLSFTVSEEPEVTSLAS